MHPIEPTPWIRALEWRVRLDEAAPKEERLRSIAILQEVNAPVRYPMSVVQLRGQLRGLRNIVELAPQSVRIENVLVAVFDEKVSIVVAVRMLLQFFGYIAALKAPVANVLRKVHFADAVGLVASVSKGFHETRSRFAGIYIVDASRDVRGQSAGQRTTSGAADGARRMAVGEGRAFANQSIDVGRSNLGVSKRSNAVEAKLVGKQKKDVGRFGEWHSRKEIYANAFAFEIGRSDCSRIHSHFGVSVRESGYRSNCTGCNASK